MLVVGSVAKSGHENNLSHALAGAVQLFELDYLGLAEFSTPVTRIDGAWINGHFGNSVALTRSGGLIVGAPNEGAPNNNGHLGPGKVYVFSNLELGVMSNNC